MPCTYNEALVWTSTWPLGSATKPPQLDEKIHKRKVLSAAQWPGDTCLRWWAKHVCLAYFSPKFHWNISSVLKIRVNSNSAIEGCCQWTVSFRKLNWKESTHVGVRARAHTHVRRKIKFSNTPSGGNPKEALSSKSTYVKKKAMGWINENRLKGCFVITGPLLSVPAGDWHRGCTQGIL